MSSPVIWSGSIAKNLKSGLQFGSSATIYSGSADPTSSSTIGNVGDLYISTNGNTYQKITTSATDTNWKLISVAFSAGDISETSFSIANNQSSAANVTGLVFANATVRAFEAIASIYINATASKYETFTLNGIQRGSDWQMSQTSVGDSSGIVFSITTAGQVKYTSTNNSGFVSGTIKFKAWTLGA